MLNILLTTFYCKDAISLSGFWAEALGYEYRVKQEHWVILVDPAGTGVGLGFQPVPEKKEGTNRVHLDILVRDEPIEASRERLHGLGATTLRFIDNGDEGHHYIMQDPEGNEFCLVPGPGSEDVS